METKRIVLDSQLKMYEKFERFLVLPEVNGAKGYVQVLEKMQGVAQGNGSSFKGTFKLRNFPDGFPVKCVNFTLLDREIPVGQIKAEVSSIISKVDSLKSFSINNLAVSFMGFIPQKDDATLSGDLSCHGRGGETFYLTYKG